MTAPAPIVPPPPMRTSIAPEVDVVDVVACPVLRAQRQALARRLANVSAVVFMAGSVACASLLGWAACAPTTNPAAYLSALLVLAGWGLVLLLPGHTIFTKGGWLETDGRLTGLYLRLTPRYVEYGHQHGRWSTPWTAIRSIQTLTLPGLDNGVVLLVAADGWGPFKTRHSGRYLDVLIPNTDAALGVVEHIANYATVGRLTIHYDQPPRDGEAGEPGP